MPSDHVLRLYDKQGHLHTVMLSAELWHKGEARFTKIIADLLEPETPSLRPEPLEEWQDFLTYWDFPYPQSPDVTCGNCQTSTPDWTEDPNRPFRLKSAQLGGLVVFHCVTCGATVRKKHFKDHVCFEYTPADSR